MSEPLVSIIMGVYNGEKTISDCIESVLSQTYSNWEFIICDDYSSDHTFGIIKQYQKKDNRIIVLQNSKNMRLAASLNKCLHYAHGKYIARMDADDRNMPKRLEKQVAFLESHPEYDMVGCNRIIFDENGELGIRRSIEFPDKNILVKDTPFAHPTIVMKKSVYDDLGGYTVSKATIRAEDLDLWFRFYEKEYSGYNLQEPLYLYREGIQDMKKRTLGAAVQTAKVYIAGYRRLQFPWYKRAWAIKPIIAAMLPKKIMGIYQKTKLQ